MTSTFLYTGISFSSRFALQRHYVSPLLDLKVSVLTSVNDTRSLEDIKLLNSFRHIESITGRKPVLVYFGSKYLGTVKRSFSLIKVDFRSRGSYFFIEQLATLLLPNLQKRFGRSIASGSTPKVQLFCKDLQLFSNYSALFSCDPISFSVSSSSSLLNKVFFDFLCLYKFNFL